MEYMDPLGVLDDYAADRLVDGCKVFGHSFPQGMEIHTRCI